MVIGAVRVLGSLLVLRWAFAGGVIAVLIDFSDLFLMNLLDLGGVRDYQAFDKYLDQVYQFTFLVVALRWTGPARTVSIWLYVYRLVGFLVFEVTQQRSVLLLFPNVFEFWFLFVAGMLHWRPGFALTWKTSATFGAVLLVAKEFQEYALHQARWLDGFTAVEGVQAVWDWLTAPLR